MAVNCRQLRIDRAYQRDRMGTMTGTDTHVRLPRQLVDAARDKAGLPAGAGTAQVIRYALATLAGWPDDAARTTARLAVGRRQQQRS
jgi:hypothetical protein